MKLIYRIIRSLIKRDKFNLNLSLFVYPQIRSESVCSNQFNCYACVRHQIEANDALVMPL